jgi:hypothetical protein
LKKSRNNDSNRLLQENSALACTTKTSFISTQLKATMHFFLLGALLKNNNSASFFAIYFEGRQRFRIMKTGTRTPAKANSSNTAQDEGLQLTE